MFQFRNLNTDPHSNVMSDFLMCIRNHSDNLSTICRSHNQLTGITNDLMGYYFSERSVIRQYRNLSEMQQEMRLPMRSTSTSTTTRTRATWQEKPPRIQKRQLLFFLSVRGGFRKLGGL